MILCVRFRVCAISLLRSSCAALLTKRLAGLRIGSFAGMVFSFRVVIAFVLDLAPVDEWTNGVLARGN